jgi:uncharacterized protein
MRILLRISAILLCALPFAHPETVPSLPAPTGYIDDFAKVLAPPTRTELEAECRDLHAQTRAQVFLVTIHTLDGETKEQFANDLFAKWKIGEKKTDRGVLILLAIDDHKYWTEVGYGLEGLLNDAKVGDIGREMVPFLKTGDYDAAARTSVDAIARIIAADAHVTLAQPAQPVAASQAVPVASGSASDGVVFILLITFGLLFWIVFLARRSRTGSRTPINSYAPPPYSPTPTLYTPDPYIPTPPQDTQAPAVFWAPDSSSTTSTPIDTFSGGDGGASGGGGAGGDW